MWLPVFLAATVTGCTTARNTDPARTATEQLLLSTAADRALRSAELGMFAGKKVFLDGSYFESYDSKYALGTIRDALSRAGAILVPTAAASEVIVEARSGALATDSSTSLFGVPALGVPLPLTGSLQVPEIAFYKSQKENSTAKIALLAITRPGGLHIYSSGSLVGKAYEHSSRYLVLSFHHTDVPEKQGSEKKTDEYQSWMAVYAPQNLEVTGGTNSLPATSESTNNVAP